MNSSCERELGPHIFVASNDKFSQVIVILCIVNTLTAIISTTENLVVAAAILRTRSLHTPSLTLLCGLALSDLAVGFISQPIFVAFNLADLYRNCELFSVIAKVHEYFACQLVAVTFLAISATAVERFLALKIHLRYRELVTIRRTVLCLLFIWIIASIFATWLSTHRPSADTGMVVLVLIFLFNNGTCYWKIFRIIRHHQRQIENQFHVQHQGVQRTGPNIARYRKSVCSLLYVAGFFCLSFFPWVVLGIAIQVINKGYTVEIVLAERILYTITYLNSCFNPLLYCWRIEEIRQAIKEQLKVICCTLNLSS